MFGKLFQRRPAVTPGPSAETPSGTVIWAVGDIHGRLDLLNPLLDGVLSDLRTTTAERRIIVFLGDYIDRGPDSAGVIERLCDLKDEAGIECRFIRGNHEDRMEAFLSDPSLGPGWCDYGGREALKSYGISAPMLRGQDEGWAEVSAALGGALSARHRAFLADQESAVALGDYFFTHAGARPGVPLSAQSTDDLMWIRQAFLDSRDSFDRVVVHGHTPADAVHADHRRIGIDTGAYATGVLTALRLEGADRAVLQTSLSRGGVKVVRRAL